MTTALKVFLVLSVLLTSRRTAAFFKWNSEHPRPVSVKLIRHTRMGKQIVPITPLFATFYDVPKRPAKVTKVVVFVSPYKPIVPASVGFKYIRQGNAKSRPQWLARRAENNYGYQ